jgi:hypothetical protein
VATQIQQLAIPHYAGMDTMRQDYEPFVRDRVQYGVLQYSPNLPAVVFAENKWPTSVRLRLRNDQAAGGIFA